MNKKSLYLYCITEASKKKGKPRVRREQTFRIHGLDRGKVFAFLNHSLAAVVQECDASFLSEDPRWVKNSVLTHQAVVDHAWKKFGNVVPFSFSTLVLPKEAQSATKNLEQNCETASNVGRPKRSVAGSHCLKNLREWMNKEEDSLKKLLEKLKGKAEYGIQISWNPNLIASQITRNDREFKELEKEIQEKGTGTQYLLQHKKKNLLRQKLEAVAEDIFREFYDKISHGVKEIRVETIRKEKPPRQMLMNLSCLLPKDDVPKLDKVLEEIAKGKGFFVRFTGPWPPYSFAKL
ncbi:MAG: GvpL/GvpF family gas vesicle protein [Gammaproteobacteria bacterium]|nr:GvpL/GvpF family gas vesicle protein [Gammaproteobacteria bacterium]